MLVTRAIAARFCASAGAHATPKPLNRSARGIQRCLRPQNEHFQHFSSPKVRTFASSSWLQVPNYDVELVRRGRLIAWLSYNALGIRALSELVEYVTKSKGSAPAIPTSFGWCTPTIFFSSGEIFCIEMTDLYRLCSCYTSIN
jgi:hypothetical protein